MDKGAGTGGGKGKRPAAPAGCYWRGNTLWARFKIDGIEYRRSLDTGSPRVAADRRERKRQEIIGAIRYGETGPVAWPDAVLAWTETPPDNLSAKTVRRYASSLIQLAPILEPYAVQEIDGDALRAVIAERRKVASKRTVQRDLTAISSVLDVAIERNWIKDNAAHALDRRKLREAGHTIVLPRASDVEQVIAACPGKLGDVARFAWETGARLDEVLSLHRADIDEKRRQAVLHFGAKRAKTRTIPLSRAAVRIAVAQPAKLKEPRVFWGPSGKVTNASSRFSRIVRGVAQKAAQAGGDFRPFRFHDLRHLFAVAYLKRGGSIYDLQHLLGHGSIKTTEIYLRFLTPGEAAAARGGTKSGTRAAVRGGADGPNVLENGAE